MDAFTGATSSMSMFFFFDPPVPKCSSLLDCSFTGKLFQTSDAVEDESDSETQITVPKRKTAVSARAKHDSEKSGRKKKNTGTGRKKSEAVTSAVPTTSKDHQVSPALQVSAAIDRSIHFGTREAKTI
jgi:hypothetical protein